LALRKAKGVLIEGCLLMMKPPSDPALAGVSGRGNAGVEPHTEIIIRHH